MAGTHPSTDMTVEELKRRLDASDPIFILDVRNPDEFAFCRLPGSTLIPMGDVPGRLQELDPEAETVVHCRSGGRSAQVVAYLRQQGFTNVRNLAGGILAWADRIDPSVPKY